MPSATLQRHSRRPLIGAQIPRIRWCPRYSASAGEEVIDLAQHAGLTLDKWQQGTLMDGLALRPNGSWLNFEVGIVGPRQNGKNGVLEARELGGLFVLGERLIIHSAHMFDTSLEAFRRLLFLIENNPDFDRRVKRVSRAHGEEGIELKGGQRIRFRTRTKGGGRGFSGDCVILDEAMECAEATHGALFPIVSARPNPQIWYAASAVDELVHDNGIVLARLRERGIAGGDPSLAYSEWSVDRDEYEKHPALADDPAAWAQANPALGIRISQDHIEKERRSMAERTFIVERLGVGYWPRTDRVHARVIAQDKYEACIDHDSKPADPVCFAFDVTPDRSRAAIGVAGARKDGPGEHIEVVDHHRRTDWVVARALELDERHKPRGWVCDASGPAASLMPAFAEAGIEVTPISAREYAQACGMIFDGFDQGTVHHLDTPELAAAVDGALKKQAGEAWKFSRASSLVDISPLVSVTLARWGLATIDPPKRFDLKDYRIRRA